MRTSAINSALWRIPGCPTETLRQPIGWIVSHSHLKERRHVNSVLQLFPAQSASRIPKPCDRLRKILVHGFFGDIEIFEQARQRSKNPARFGPVKCLYGSAELFGS
jgi:hypothetical protein